ncbi:MAG: hypothetical protein KJS92_07475, partial [Bacteroidetes bacterium]|nr:hypothetical protein [Bacteroidota bacterium]
RQGINTPFINMQDGRMRTTAVSGLWLDSDSASKLRISGGIIQAISPRGALHWFKTAHSIGFYPVGYNPDGTHSGYAGNIQSKGLALLGLNYDAYRKWQIQIWQMLIDNVSYSALAQISKVHSFGGTCRIKISAQSIVQHSIHQGGNQDLSKSYFGKNQHSLSFGGSAALIAGGKDISINYTRITAAGRYLIPREWGRDPFFTFMLRERNEGLGDVHALVVKSNWTAPSKNLKYNLSAGYFRLPNVHQTRLNKYGMPSYVQVNSDLRYAFLKGWLKGLDAQFLLVHKRNAGAVYNNPKYIYNKVDMTLYNIVFNYSFSLYRPAIKK